jgi:hypothetical protein
VSGPTLDTKARRADETRGEQSSETGPSPASLRPSSLHQPSLGKRLRIRSMVSVAGEVLPFFWPMRNFIHHNPLNGLEHLLFEEAVAEAGRLFHARGWLPRTDYQRLLAEGHIRTEDLAREVDAFVDDWLASQGGAPEADSGTADSDGPDPETRSMLREILLAMLTLTSQPTPGDREPCAEDVLACLKRSDGAGQGDGECG